MSRAVTPKMKVTEWRYDQLIVLLHYFVELFVSFVNKYFIQISTSNDDEPNIEEAPTSFVESFQVQTNELTESETDEPNVESNVTDALTDDELNDLDMVQVSVQKTPSVYVQSALKDNDVSDIKDDDQDDNKTSEKIVDADDSNKVERTQSSTSIHDDSEEQNTTAPPVSLLKPIDAQAKINSPIESGLANDLSCAEQQGNVSEVNDDESSAIDTDIERSLAEATLIILANEKKPEKHLESFNGHHGVQIRTSQATITVILPNKDNVNETSDSVIESYALKAPSTDSLADNDGQVIVARRLTFEANTHNISTDSLMTLGELKTCGVTPEVCELQANRVVYPTEVTSEPDGPLPTAPKELKASMTDGPRCSDEREPINREPKPNDESKDLGRTLDGTTNIVAPDATKVVKFDNSKNLHYRDDFESKSNLNNNSNTATPDGAYYSDVQVVKPESSAIELTELVERNSPRQEMPLYNPSSTSYAPYGKKGLKPLDPDVGRNKEDLDVSQTASLKEKPKNETNCSSIMLDKSQADETDVELSLANSMTISADWSSDDEDVTIATHTSEHHENCDYFDLAGMGELGIPDANSTNSSENENTTVIVERTIPIHTGKQLGQFRSLQTVSEGNSVCKRVSCTVISFKT